MLLSMFYFGYTSKIWIHSKHKIHTNMHKNYIFKFNFYLYNMLKSQ